MFGGARILVAPLDWGLGHATRDVPIIRALLEHDARPLIGADNAPLALLRDEFPQLPWVRIPGVEVRYARGRSQHLAMAAQFPAMLRSIRTEHEHLVRLRREHRLDAIISDQRFGLRAQDIPSVLVTHQVFPFTPLAQGALRRLNRYNIQRFDRCWIPDEATAPGLSGELAHGPNMPGTARFIGAISRMSRPVEQAGTKHTIVAVISGPEPQRTLLEEALIPQMQAIEGEHLLVRGSLASHEIRTKGNVRMLPHLNATELARALYHARYIIARSGYTTLLDLEKLGRTALLIPTPGQLEQEYLADLHSATGRFTTQQQHQLRIADGLVRADLRTAPTTGSDLLAGALQELAERIHQPATPTFAQ